MVLMEPPNRSTGIYQVSLRRQEVQGEVLLFYRRKVHNNKEPDPGKVLQKTVKVMLFVDPTFSSGNFGSSVVGQNCGMSYESGIKT